MNKELQDKAWSVLPKEFKEEVKKLYREFTFTREGYYVELFGLHNLTSDAEGEEMLTVSSNSVRVYKENIDRYLPKAVSAYDKGFWIGQDVALRDLFGSKCLPDGTKNDTKEPKPAEPKFKVGDKVRHKGDGKTYTIHMGNGFYLLEDENRTIKDGAVAEQHLEPYTEPKENVNHRQNIANCDKHLDNILKDSFRNERRLNIAAMAMQGILSNPTAMNGPKLIDGDEEILAKWSLKFADALIAKCELTEKLKGG